MKRQMNMFNDLSVKAYFSFGFVIVSFVNLIELNNALSIVLKFTGLISFCVYMLLNYPRIKVRIKNIFRKW